MKIKAFAVVDTNVLVSSLMTDSFPKEIMKLIQNENVIPVFELNTTPKIVYRSTLDYRIKSMDSIEMNSHYGDYDVEARRQVGKFLHNREYAMQYEDFKPYGLTVKNVIDSQYEYNKEHGFYSPTEPKKEKDDYEFDDK